MGQIVVNFRSLGGGELSCALGARLDRDRFNAYLEATRRNDFPYDGRITAQRGKVEDFGRLVVALKAAGFGVAVEPAAREVLVASAAEIRARADASDALAAASAAEFAARGLRLFPFQETGATFLRSRSCALLADQMGLGKTIQALAALPAGARVLVSAPAAVKGVWKFEVGRWRPEYRVEVLKGRGTFRVPEGSEVLVLNPELLPAEVPADLPQGVVLVVDEAHMFKGRATARTKRLRALSEAVIAKGGKVWLLTGTPLLNRPAELWSVLDNAGLAREAFGSFRRFESLFNGAGSAEVAAVDATRASEFAACLRKVSLMRLRAEVMPELPRKTFQTVVFGDLDAHTRANLDRLAVILEASGFFGKVKDAVASVEGMVEGGGSEDEKRAHRIAFEEIARIRAEVATAKIPTLLAVVEEYEAAEEPLVVFSAHKAPAEAVGTRPGWALITGDTAPEKRTAIVEDFQAGLLKGVALTIRAGGVGLTLTKACSVVFNDLEWTPALNSQAEDRVCRIGQTRPVIVKAITADHPIDYRLQELLHLKAGYVETVEGSAVAAETDTARLLRAKAVALEDAVKATADAGPTETEVPAKAAGKRVTVPMTRNGETKYVAVTVRPPENDLEAWAARGMMTLAGCDVDRARVLNGVGFNKLDGHIGHAFAEQFGEHGGFSEGQWRLVVSIAKRYTRQIGNAPTPVVSTAG